MFNYDGLNLRNSNPEIFEYEKLYKTKCCKVCKGKNIATEYHESILLNNNDEWELKVTELCEYCHRNQPKTKRITFNNINSLPAIYYYFKGEKYNITEGCKTALRMYAFANKNNYYLGINIRNDGKFNSLIFCIIERLIKSNRSEKFKKDMFQYISKYQQHMFNQMLKYEVISNDAD